VTPRATPIRSLCEHSRNARAINELMPLSNHVADCVAVETVERISRRESCRSPSSGSFSSRQLRPLSSRVKTREIIRCITLREALRFRVTEQTSYRRIIVSLSLSLGNAFVNSTNSRTENRAQRRDRRRFVRAMSNDFSNTVLLSSANGTTLGDSESSPRMISANIINHV